MKEKSEEVTEEHRKEKKPSITSAEKNPLSRWKFVEKREK